MRSGKKLMIIGILFLTCIGCDQTTKQIAKQTLQFELPVSLLNDLLRFQYAENRGGMMSIGADLPDSVRFWFLTVFVGILLTGIFLYTLLSNTLTRPQTVALTLIVGGGFSNLLDRIRHDGHVIDFMNVGLSNIRTGIFNIADVIIIAGTVILLVATSKPHRENPSE